MKNRRENQIRLDSGRTSNDAEIQVAKALRSKGWRVLKRGWPDFVATKGSRVLFVEVKPDSRGLSGAQKEIAAILQRFGIQVRVVSPKMLKP